MPSKVKRHAWTQKWKTIENDANRAETWTIDKSGNKEKSENEFQIFRVQSLRYQSRSLFRSASLRETQLKERE